MGKENFIISLRNNDVARKSVAGFVFLFHFYAVIQMFFNEEFLTVFHRIRMFTNISNILIFVIVGLYLLNFKDSKWFKYLSVIGLVAILMTGIIYHGLLSDGYLDFNGHVVHTINPILYPVFYFLLVTPSIRLYHFWISLILPLLYFGIILAIGPLTNWYPYSFMNPTLEGKSLGSVLVFCLGILLPVIAIFTVLLISLKIWLEKKIAKA